MRKLYSRFCLGLLASFFSYASFAQVSVTATAGTTGPTAYTTLKAAFDAVNGGTHQGVITVNITGNTTETATAAINASGAGLASYTAVNVTTSGTFTVSMNAALSLISLNGADNVTINGNNTLTLTNTNASGQVISFSGDATTNTIKKVNIKGATNLVTSGFPTSGVIFFGTGTTTGNDTNTIDSCDVDGTSNAVCLLFSAGTITTTTLQNSGCTVKNSNFRDYVNAASGVAIGLALADGNTGWTLQNNSFFMTAAISTTQQLFVRGILVTPDYITDTHTVTGNYFGGNATGATGTMSLTGTGAGVIGFSGLDIETGGTGNMVSNNTVRNVTGTYTSALGSFSNVGLFGFIGGYNGTSTFTNNTVSNINLTNTGGFLTFQGIHVNGRITAAGTVTPAFTVTNNNINNLTLNATGAASDVQAHGIRLETSSTASLTTTSTSNPTFTVTGNTISNITIPATGTASFFRAIGTIGTEGTSATALLYPKVDINNNTIHTISNASQLSNPASGVVTGVHFGGSVGGTNTTDIAKINQNTIYNLSATSTMDSSISVIGILATNGVHEIQRNKIYDLKNAAIPVTPTKAPTIIGITVRNAAAASSVFNNFVSLGSTVTNDIAIFGIVNNFNATGPVNVSYNTVVITGAGAAGNTRPSAVFARGSETLSTTIATPINLRNNILYNSRTGGGSHFAILNTNATPTAGWTSSYNNIYTVTAANAALWGLAPITAATYNTNASDPNSKNVTVSFVNVATGDLHLSGASATDANLNAIPVAGITTDFDGDTRSATTPKIGADEPNVACVAPAITVQPTAQAVCAGSALNLSVTATGTNLAYQWRKGGTNITGATSATFTIATTVAGDAGNYDVVITNSCGNVTSSTVAVTINAGPAITAQPTAQAVCNGANATFTVTATGTVTYQWRLNGANVTTGTGGTTNSYTVPASAATAGNYTVVVSNGTCSTTSSAAALTINAATAITTQPAPRSACFTTSTTFTVAATGTGLTYQWRKNNVNVTTGTGGTTASYTLTNVALADAGNYDVVITGTCGNVTSTAAALTVTACTSVPSVDVAITSVVMTPNVVRDVANVRVSATKAMKLSWTIVDAQGKVVMTLNSQVAPGRNDIALYVGQLSSGTYQLKGTTAKGVTSVIRFVKM